MGANDFEVGDAVRLNCSTFRMTVDRIDEGNPIGEVVCIWMNDEAELREAHFHPPQLVKLNKPK